MLVVTAFFHQPPQLIDVLSQQSVPYLEIRTSPWRIIFEPFLGPLLFYLRANHPLIEFTVLFIWIVLGLLVWTLFKYKNPPFSGILRWLTMLPLWVMLMLGLMAFAVFLPLPADRLKNHDPERILVNFHSHSYYSHDGILSPQKVVRWHRTHSFDAFFLTEHNNHQMTLERVAAQRRGELPSTPLVLCGQEYSGSNHLLLLGLNKNVNTKDMPDSTAVQTAHQQNGVALVAHWFRKKPRPLDYYVRCGVDGFEILNQNEGLYYDRSVFEQIVRTCSSNGLLAVGSCDFHGYGNVCSVWNVLFIPGWHSMTPNGQYLSIMELLKTRDQRRISVVLYKDRHVIDNILWSPPLTIIDYFRSLKTLQRLAWIIWLFVFWLTMKKLAKKKQVYGRFMHLTALISSFWLIIWGGYFYYQSRILIGDNEIFHEYSLWFIFIGLAGSIFSLYLARKKILNS